MPYLVFALTAIATTYVITKTEFGKLLSDKFNTPESKEKK